MYISYFDTHVKACVLFFSFVAFYPWLSCAIIRLRSR